MTVIIYDPIIFCVVCGFLTGRWCSCLFSFSLLFCLSHRPPSTPQLACLLCVHASFHFVFGPPLVFSLVFRYFRLLKMYYDLKLTLLGQLGFLAPVTTVYMVHMYVPEHLRSHRSQIDENQHYVGSKQKLLTNN